MKIFLKAGLLTLSATALSVLLFSGGCSQNTQSAQNADAPIARAPSTPPTLVPKDSDVETQNPKIPKSKNPKTPSAKKPIHVAHKTKAASIDWQPSFETALKKARALQKPIMVDFFATWCGPCHFLAEEIYPAPAMVVASKDFVSVQVDVDKRPDLMQKYQAASLPTVAFLDATGKEISRQEGVPGDPQAAVDLLVGSMKDARQKFAGTPA